ncbi:hypothetical protein O1L55_10550 [Streptomyces albulus]|nr:hypothetical protein [Streptomyces noursei]
MATSPTRPADEPGDLATHLMDQALGHLFSAALRTAAHYRIADRLALGPRTPEQLAAATDTHAPTCAACCATSPPAASSARTPRARTSSPRPPGSCAPTCPTRCTRRS